MNGLLEDRDVRCQVELAAVLNGGADESVAWRRLLAQVHQLAFQCARHRYGLAHEDAEDVAQVVQIRVLQRVGQLRDPRAFLGWVRRLAHHAVVDHLRRRRDTLSLEALTGPEGEAAPDDGSLEVFDQIVLRADLTRALERLPQPYREAIELHVLQGLPQDEVGRLLGRPRSTVASQIVRGLRRMERTLSGLNSAV